MRSLRASVPFRDLSFALALFAGVLVPALAFAKVAEEVWEKDGFSWDVSVLLWVHDHASPTLDDVMIAFTRVGSVYGVVPMVAAALLYLLARRRRGDALFFAASIAGAMALNGLLKISVQRARPSLWVSPDPAEGFGFPSGHAMSSMAIATALSLLAWPTRWRWAVAIVGYLLVFGIGFSRVYLGVHYPSDIIAGWCASLAWVTGLALIRTRWRRKAPGHLSSIPDYSESSG